MRWDPRLNRKPRRILGAVITVLLFAIGISPIRGETTHGRVFLLRDIASVVLEGGVYPARAGDVNGDGRDDLVVSLCTSENDRGIARVVFGPRPEGRHDLERDGDWGFAIRGPAEGAMMCRATGAGDVNADGMDDIVVGAPSHSNAAGQTAGVAYVVFGKTDHESVELEDFDRNIQGPRGFRVDGNVSRDRAGEDVAGLGDVNGDGLDDVAISAPFAGATYVVFGKASPEPTLLAEFDLGIQGSAGYRIQTAVPNLNELYSVAGIGDANGDGRPDVAVGVMRGPRVRGSLYVTFGKPDAAPLDVRRLGDAGYRILGPYEGSLAGYASAPLGDLNRDGKNDLIVGAPSVFGNGAGSVFVVFGKDDPAPIKLGDLGRKGLSIRGARHFRNPLAFGYSVAGIGDVNRDSVPDAAIGAPAASFHGAKVSGSVYVLNVDLERRQARVRDFRRWGRRFDGPNRLSVSGADVASIGDFDGDGRADVAVNALETNPEIPVTYVFTP